MRLSPREVDRLTLSEFSAMMEGFAASKGAKSDEPTAEDYALHDVAFAAFHAKGLA